MPPESYPTGIFSTRSTEDLRRHMSELEQAYTQLEQQRDTLIDAIMDDVLCVQDDVVGKLGKVFMKDGREMLAVSASAFVMDTSSDECNDLWDAMDRIRDEIESCKLHLEAMGE